MEKLKPIKIENINGDQNRRGFLQRVLPVVLTTGLLADCTSPAKLPFDNTSPEKVVNVESGNNRLVEEINLLPDSPVKKLLVERWTPFFSENPPRSKIYDGLEINIYKPTVQLKTVNLSTVSGMVSPRAPRTIGVFPGAVFPAKDTVLQLPYIDVILDSEQARIPANNFAKDGTPIIHIHFSTDKAIYEGLNPEITVTVPVLSNLKQEFVNIYKNQERFCFIRSACSLLLADIYIEEVVKKMNKLGFDTTMETRAINGNKGRIEGITQALTVLNSADGRFAAIFDMAGYFLAYKAIEGTVIDNPKLMDAKFLKLRPGMKALEMGKTSKDILSNSFYWAITSKEANQLVGHRGKIEDLP